MINGVTYDHSAESPWQNRYPQSDEHESLIFPIFGFNIYNGNMITGGMLDDFQLKYHHCDVMLKNNIATSAQAINSCE